MITVGIPVLNYYQGLFRLLTDLDICNKKSNLIEKVIVVDNGGQGKFVSDKSFSFDCLVHNPEKNMGLAWAWNYILDNSAGTRLIANDDIRVSENFLSGFIEKIDTESVCYFQSVGCSLNAFSLFTITDYVVDKVGLFDEAISPNYAYFEDNDYFYRMERVGIELKQITLAEDINISHGGSKTLHNLNPEDSRAHNAKFELAKKNYIKKWGGIPRQEKFLNPYGK